MKELGMAVEAGDPSAAGRCSMGLVILTILDAAC